MLTFMRPPLNATPESLTVVAGSFRPRWELGLEFSEGFTYLLASPLQYLHELGHGSPCVTDRSAYAVWASMGTYGHVAGRNGCVRRTRVVSRVC